MLTENFNFFVFKNNLFSARTFKCYVSDRDNLEMEV